jgi:peptidoglycan/LPS O-acetylase OafA/YrhL
MLDKLKYKETNAWPTNSARLEFVDSVRGWAILLVVLVHSAGLMTKTLPQEVNNIAYVGARGVQLFFIISSFSLFYSLRNKNFTIDRNSLAAFYLRRFFRIAPMFYFAILAYLALPSAGILGHNGKTILNSVSHFTFTFGLWPKFINTIVPGGWSVATEVGFYLLIPLIFLRIKNLKQSIIFILFSYMFSMTFYLLVNNSLGLELFGKEVWNNWVFFSLPTQLPAFAFGIFLFFLVLKINENKRHLNLALEYSNIILFAGLVGCVALVVQGQVNSILFVIPLFLIVLSLSLKKNDFFVNKPLSFIGRISFSVYLLHFIILDTIGSYINKILPYPWHGAIATANLVIIFIVVTIATSFFAYITYRLIEINGMYLGVRFSKVVAKK